MKDKKLPTIPGNQPGLRRVNLVFPKIVPKYFSKPLASSENLLYNINS
jgi:hypothetical protein